MSIHRHSRSLPSRFRLVLSSFLQRPGLPFADALSEEAIQKAFEEEHPSHAEDSTTAPAKSPKTSVGEDDDVVYTSAITLWSFLSQVLFKNEQRSCIAAVARVSVLLVALERGPCSSNTGAYCRARAKLSEKIIHRLTVEVAAGCERQVPRVWLWHGRHVRLVDGTTVSMPDTPSNQAAYPQSRSQPKGLGFPIARVVVLLSLATGMLTDMALGPCTGKETGETALLRPLLSGFEPGDILLADRYFCSYFMIALLRMQGVDFVTRIHQRRDIDFRRGRRLGQGDHIVQWKRPQKPDWMDQPTYDRIPASIEVREVHVHVGRPGFRAESLVVVTTLTDDAQYAKDDVADLYHARWLAELDIRSIKISMGMDVLRCKTPAMVRKEMWTCLLAYNLIRQTILQSAQKSGHRPRNLSFTAALQSVAAGWLVVVLSEDCVRANLIDALLALPSEHLVGDRPNRIEPRAVKRRAKPHDLLTQPRAEARAQLLAGRQEKSS